MVIADGTMRSFGRLSVNKCVYQPRQDWHHQHEPKYSMKYVDRNKNRFQFLVEEVVFNTHSEFGYAVSRMNMRLAGIAQLCRKRAAKTNEKNTLPKKHP